MRSPLILIALLAAGAAAASRWPATPDQRTPASLEWVRTADGWERSALLNAAPRRGERLHPLTVAAIQVLGAGVALAAGWRVVQVAEDEWRPAVDAPPTRRRASSPVAERSPAQAS
ncbi:hypothetical protein KOR34_43050 [Posidoniimonas corsicana]|uniref:Uncharacterized protein n=1 Tax=Posidoniimonas corsicana TaxID=1938618 RepID=A0A5C5V476_9BACT|nr:hypothetical protein [Posidoniimonas corsicana]TWT32542.1 hypothetical protein KOR34_43050 [Posidoniimonas corsicana]